VSVSARQRAGRTALGAPTPPHRPLA